MDWDDLFEYLDFPVRCRGIGCDYLRETPDGSGTGDSPAHYECEARRVDDCPHYDEAYDDYWTTLYNNR